ncbi:probable tRNA (uracil-O(2)-)-methyltransferase [Mercenaria mercenaria]|uniref:probable tRNA (uracil-O(2)-)-methyltransferase n=1 Tax=Mercenaria mercenaria TaxID=6596 RepID=UPI00234E4EFB|nr:probable tRNA (uracil-O(2)-)-methyltransferase [Mercenaria mercenaria]
MIENFVNFEEELAEEHCNGSSDGFANALTVWLNKPHVVNRRLCGSRLEYFEIISKEQFNIGKVTNIIERHCLELNGFCFYDIFKSQGFTNDNSAEIDLKLHTNVCIEGLDGLSEDEIAVIVRQLLPKQPERHANIPELVVFDKSKDSCTFIPLKPANDSERKVPLEVLYCFRLKDKPKKKLCLFASTSDCSTDSERKLSLTWIKGLLLQKLARWSEQPSLRTGLASLLLVSVEDYSRLYSELKNKYGIPLAQKWPEKTSAQKYVFEDVAIATYLLLLWEDDRKKKGLTKKQSFVDLGSGNGLLVHILASEGHPGYGIDVRRRKIWDLYGPETILKEMTITPSTESVFPDSDWLIGNHSDELTPWIPVMAARSSYTCNYFVLPCCMWDFNARYSFTQKVANGSENSGKYGLYLDFVKSVGENCGFKVEEDMLRIPSTKRVCLSK